ncbi:hypothetical protein ACFFLM_00225 [Deinococcus oregonensis]|uniref:Uncharacterized protein n=1 Tax=Deinococcus oregonensis TaxID=1805970 RepID=A0ABV6ASE2_9DEIO
MTIAAWEAWVATLPVDLLELEQVRMELLSEIEEAEHHLADLLELGGTGRIHRQTTIELMLLNSKLRLLQTRLIIA